MKNLCTPVSFLFLLIQVLPAPVRGQSAPKEQSNDPLVRERITTFFHYQAAVKDIYSAALSPDGKEICWSSDGKSGPEIFIAPVKNPSRTRQISAGEAAAETEPQWSPDGRRIAFFSDARSKGQPQVFIADAGTGKLYPGAPLTTLSGFASHLKWSPDGLNLSFLYVPAATREPSPMAAENRATGLIDSSLNRDVQQLMTINVARRHMERISPEGLYVYEYDWAPDNSGFAFTAAAPPGDDNWYVARLYRQKISGDTIAVYVPAFQIAVPRWSPDGQTVAFIEGLMSDQGGTGGEVFVVAAAGGTPRNMTPGRTSTPSWIGWAGNGTLLMSEFTGGSVALVQLSLDGNARTLWQADANLHAGPETMSVSTAGKQIAVVLSDWNHLPAVYAGTPDRLKKITGINDSLPLPTVRPQNIVWGNDGGRVQGWLLYPEPYDSAKSYPLLVSVHGGPAWITTPGWSAADFNTTVYPRFGYFVFFPNPRGSYGQGESFTRANRADWGFGDLSDILTGIDTLLARFPIDSNRVGMLGWSYGGSMAMISPLRSRRFGAAVAGAGAGDWLSYYGQNGIDKWMKSYFAISPYQDPLPYQRVSAMTYIRNAATPTLLLVGERDGESPAPQSFQYWHALKELGVPTQLMVYPDEGHAFGKFENMIDVSVRTLQWFNQYLAPFGRAAGLR